MCRFLWCKHSYCELHSITYHWMRRWEEMDSVGSRDSAVNIDSYSHSWHKPRRSWWIIILICTHICNKGHKPYCHLKLIVGYGEESCDKAHQYFNSKNAWIFTVFVINTMKRLISLWVKLVIKLVLVPNLLKKFSLRNFLIFRIIDKSLWTWSFF